MSRRTVGRLLAALRLMDHLRRSHDTQTLALVERCFSPGFTYVRKSSELDKILKRYVLVLKSQAAI